MTIKGSCQPIFLVACRRGMRGQHNKKNSSSSKSIRLGSGFDNARSCSAKDAILDSIVAWYPGLGIEVTRNLSLTMDRESFFFFIFLYSILLNIFFDNFSSFVSQ